MQISPPHAPQLHSSVFGEQFQAAAVVAANNCKMDKKMIYEKQQKLSEINCNKGKTWQ